MTDEQLQAKIDRARARLACEVEAAKAEIDAYRAKVETEAEAARQWVAEQRAQLDAEAERLQAEYVAREAERAAQHQICKRETDVAAKVAARLWAALAKLETEGESADVRIANAIDHRDRTVARANKKFRLLKD